ATPPLYPPSLHDALPIFLELHHHHRRLIADARSDHAGGRGFILHITIDDQGEFRSIIGEENKVRCLCFCDHNTDQGNESKGEKTFHVRWFGLAKLVVGGRLTSAVPKRPSPPE